MKRLSANSVSETLMKVLEEAEDLDQVVILYRRKGSEPGGDATYGIADNEMTISETNYLIDPWKGWLFGRFHERD